MRRFPQDPRQRAGRQPSAQQQGRGPQAPIPPAGRFPPQPMPVPQQPMGRGAPVGRGFPMQQSHIQQQQQQRGGPMPPMHGRGGHMNGRGGMNGRGPPGGPIMGGRGGGRHGPVGPAFQQGGRFQQQQQPQPQHNNVMMLGRGAPPPPPPPPGNVVGGRFGPVGGHGRGPGPGPNFQQGRHQHQPRMMGRGNMHIQAPPPPPPIQHQQQPYSAQIQPPFQQQQQLQNPNNYGNSGMRSNQVMPLQGNAMPPIMHQTQPPPQQRQPQYPPATQPFPQNVNNRFPQPQSQQQMIPMSSQAAPVPPFHAASNANQLQHQQQHQQQQRPRYQPQGASLSPAKVSTAYAKEQLDQAWSEHTNNGAKYYYNSVSKQSTFDRPAVMDILPQYQGPAKSAMAVVSAAAAASTAGTTAVTKKDAKPQAWAEYTDASSGKKYYSNGVATTWERPEAFLTPEAIVAKSKQKEEDEAASAKAAASSDSANKKRKRVDKETPFRNHEEAVAAFKGLLLAKGIAPINKWNEVVKMCSADPRWNDCEAMLSTGERKQAMAEYQTRRANELRTQERQERARAKDAFLKLLSEVVPKLPNFSVWNSRFVDISEALARDERYHTVADEETRESLFLDFCEELRKHDERKKRNKKREAQDAFISFLREKEEAGVLLFSSTWNNFLSSLEESDKKDSRFKLSPVLVESDRQLYFADFLTELQAAEDEKRRRIREAQRRAEKAQRDAYRDALERAAAEGKITPSSHWRDAERVIESENTYSLVLEQDREAPREIFEAFIEEWDDVYRRDCQFLSQLVHPTSNREILVTVDTKYDAFVKALLEEAKSSPHTLAEARRIMKASEPVSSARVYFNELAKVAIEKHATPLRRGRNGARRASVDGSSSEDEGEIKEDDDEDEEAESKNEELPNQDDSGTKSTTTPVSNGKGSANETKKE